MSEAPPTRSSRASSTRSKARKRALDILFEAELRDTDPLDTLDERSSAADPPVRDYTAQLVQGVQADRDAIDTRIASALASGWSLERIPRVDRNVLRLAVFELDHPDVPNAVAISEALHLVSELSTDSSPDFVNGVLGNLAARHD